MIHELHELLQRAGRRVRSLRLWSSLAVCWLAWALVVYGLARLADRLAWNWSTAWAALAGATAISALVCWRLAARAGRDPRRLAQLIEATHPELGAMLLTALEQAPTPKFRRLGYLQTSVVRGAVLHGRSHNWADATSRGRVRLARLAHLMALAALVSSWSLLVHRTGDAARAAATGGAADLAPPGTLDVEIQPGDAEIERGATLLVIARFRSAMPPQAELVVSPARAPGAAAAARPESLAMTRSLDDPQFVGRVSDVAADLTYHVAYAGRRSRAYRITVFDYPELRRADARLQFPSYTRLEPKTLQDVRQLTAVQGTQLTLTFRLNKPVAAAQLVDRSGQTVELSPVDLDRPAGEATYQWVTTLAESQRLQLRLVDDAGRKNRLPPEFVINVTPNNPPEIKIQRPGRDVRVSPVEELDLRAALADDFGLTAWGVGYSLGGEEPVELALAPDADDDAAPVKTHALAHLIDFEALAAAADQLLSYYVWAEDIGPDGQVRRTLSDLYFAEVRPFDEVFRQGEPPADQQQRDPSQQAGQQGAGQQAEQLVELQKEIVGALWKLLRRETGPEPTAALADDASTIAAGQQQAQEQLAALVEQLSEGPAREFAEQAGDAMHRAAEAVADVQAGSLPAVRTAWTAARSAYEALLKLRAREFDVARANSGSAGSAGSATGAGSASQRQLQQLELSADENRYETQSRAQADAGRNAEQRDAAREALGRLRELARRQQDLNQRLRELQSALEAAQTEQQRQELARQLKRLREQQREILRDAESLDNDLQNPDSSAALAEAAQALEEARQRVQQAAEALDEGRLSQAVAEGARAEQQLSELRDAVRRQTGEQFSAEMRSLRDAARQLNERQQRLSQQLDELNADNRRTLRETGPREELLQELQTQRGELQEMLERMRAAVAEAEEPEPLLAGELFDAVRRADEMRVDDALELSSRMIEAGVTAEADASMRQADRGVEELRERIERAADSVLGSDAEALRRAEAQLGELAEQLRREIDAARGGAPDAAARGGQPGDEVGGDDLAGRNPGDDPGGAPADGRRGEEADGGARGEGGAADSEERDSPNRGGAGRPAGEDEPGSPAGAAAGSATDDSESGARGGQRADSGRGEGSPSGEDDESAPATRGAPDGAPRPGGAAAGGRAGGPRGGAAFDNLRDLLAGDAWRGGPITGEDFRQWADRMRSVEGLLDDPELAAEAARIRDRAEEARAEFKRHARTPDWTRLVEAVADPLDELRQRVGAELRRRESTDDLAPVDRDAAPPDFAEQVRLYYERLGAGQ